jgi:hypothetical protein
MGGNTGMKAFLIDPFEKSISEVDYSGDYNDIYKLIDAQLFDVVYIDGNNCIYVDDEGLFRNDQAFFQVGYAMLAGYGLVLGTNDKGESISPDIKLKDLAKQVKFLTREEVMRHV